jgi:uncharacterized RDD family membrane protein YckC
MASRERRARRYARRPTDTDKRSSYQQAPRGRRFAARTIDLIAVFVGSMLLYWGAAFMYYVVEGCLSNMSSCREGDAGKYTFAFVTLIAFTFPLIYESLQWRTLGKRLLGLDVVDRDGVIASRETRLRRAFAAWLPVLALLVGTSLASGGLSSVFVSVLFLYAVALIFMVIARIPTAHDWLTGTQVVYVPEDR